jgi:hypothetical protein
LVEEDPRSDTISQSLGWSDGTFDSFPQNIKSIIATLRVVVDQIDSDFKQARELILEISRQLDERKLCERNQISRIIKKVLKDKIQDGKVTEKWIEECLPPEYKRQYTKSELSSLSKQRPKRQLIGISTEGKQVSPSEGVNLHHEQSKQNGITVDKSSSHNESSTIGDFPLSGPSYKQTGQECSSCLELQNIVLELQDKVIQLSEALKRTSIPIADQIPVSGIEIPIPKENYEMVKDAMDKSNSAIFVKCDESKKFVRAVPDVDN